MAWHSNNVLLLLLTQSNTCWLLAKLNTLLYQSDPSVLGKLIDGLPTENHVPPLQHMNSMQASPWKPLFQDNPI